MLAHEKLKHDSESECDEGGMIGESGSQPMMFKKESSVIHLPPSPTIQASSGESSQLGHSVDP